MPSQLHDLKPEEVSIVGKAANRRRFLLKKGDGSVDQVKAVDLVVQLDEAGLGEELEALAGAESEELTKMAKPAGMSDGDYRKYKAAMKIMGPQLSKRFKMTPPDAEDAADQGADEADEAKKPVKAKKIAKRDDGSYDLSALPKDQRPAVEAMLRKADEEREADRERLEKAEKDLAEVKDAREREVFIRKAAEYDALPQATADDLGPILHKCSKFLEPKQYERITTILKAANAAIRSSALFIEHGRDNDGGSASDAYSQLKVEAEELRKRDPTLTPEVARARILKGNATLQKGLNDEQDERIRKGR